MIKDEIDNEYLLCNDGTKIYFLEKDSEIYINKLKYILLHEATPNQLHFDMQQYQ